MSADYYSSHAVARRALKILHRKTLGRHGTHKAHIKVLFPAYEGVIRSAESNINFTFAQADCYGVKLRLTFWVKAVYAVKNAHIAKARAFRKSGKQGRILLAHKCTFYIRKSKKLLCRIRNAYSFG